MLNFWIITNPVKWLIVEISLHSLIPVQNWILHVKSSIKLYESAFKFFMWLGGLFLTAGLMDLFDNKQTRNLYSKSSTDHWESSRFCGVEQHDINFVLQQCRPLNKINLHSMTYAGVETWGRFSCPVTATLQTDGIWLEWVTQASQVSTLASGLYYANIDTCSKDHSWKTISVSKVQQYLIRTMQFVPHLYIHPFSMPIILFRVIGSWSLPQLTLVKRQIIHLTGRQSVAGRRKRQPTKFTLKFTPLSSGNWTLGWNSVNHYNVSSPRECFHFVFVC